MDIPLLPVQAARVEKCRDACPQYLKTPVLKTTAERCKACGCFIHLLALRGPKACVESRWE